MPFLLLIFLMTCCLPIDWPDPPFGMGLTGSILVTGLVSGALLLASWIIVRTALGRIEREPERRESVAHQYGAARTYFFFASLGAFAVCLVGLGWGAAATKLGLITINQRSLLAPGAELLIVAPYLLVQLGSWGFFYDADRAFYQFTADPARLKRFWSRGGYILFLFRQQIVLVLTPLLPVLTAQAVTRLDPEIAAAAWLPFAMVAAVVAFLIFFPLVLRLLLGLSPLPAGPMRDRLTANARRLHFRYAQIDLWDTRGAVANAMVVGVVRWLRYVVFTDRLLEELADEEIEGVFGHEVGHAHHGHMLYYALFFMLSFLLVGALVQAAELADESSTLYLVAPMGLMACYMFAVFGFISRRCERQADIFGCRAGSCTNPHCQGHDWTTVLAEAGRGLCPTGIANFIRALRRVEDINGLARPKPSWRESGLPGKFHWVFRLLTGWLHTWQHSTISKRVAFLEKIAAQPEIEQRFQRRLWRLKWMIVFGLIASLLGLGAWRGWDVLLPTM